jgi:hypothetical protein
MSSAARIRVASTVTGEEIMPVASVDAAVGALSFNRDGKLLAGVIDFPPKQVFVWRSDTGEQTARIVATNADDKRIDNFVVFTENGDREYLRTRSGGTKRLWGVHFTDLKKEACARVHRNLSAEEWGRYVGDAAPHVAVCPGLPVTGP